MAALVDEDVL